GFLWTRHRTSGGRYLAIDGGRIWRRLVAGPLDDLRSAARQCLIYLAVLTELIMVGGLLRGVVVHPQPDAHDLVHLFHATPKQDSRVAKRTAFLQQAHAILSLASLRPRGHVQH